MVNYSNNSISFDVNKNSESLKYESYYIFKYSARNSVDLSKMSQGLKIALADDPSTPLSPIIIST
jgi:hypothetical protein